MNTEAANPTPSPTRMSPSIAKLAEALSAAQGELRDAYKGSQAHNYRYATLADVLEIARPVLSKHGLAVVQLPGNAGDKVSVETILLHKSGEWLASAIEMPVPPPKAMNLAQAVGCVITYARRYALAAVLGIAQVDDDANEPETPELEAHRPSLADVLARIEAAEDEAALQAVAAAAAKLPPREREQARAAYRKRQAALRDRAKANETHDAAATTEAVEWIE